jgi:adenine-specific DNA methylase
MLDATKNDLRLIEAGFPCHQVGAETQRERDTGKAPPTHRLHVWWARRPLTPSRAAILASVLPADTDPDWFLRQLGIEKRVVEINGRQWTLTGKVLARLQKSEDGMEFLYVDEKVRRDIEKENEVRQELRKFLTRSRQEEGLSAYSETITRWLKEVEPLSVPDIGSGYEVKNIVADPAWASEKQALGKAAGYRFPGDSYGYGRAFQNATFAPVASHKLVVLDPTAGGGSIPFEALRLGHKVIANELNPVASVILHATLDYPARWGSKLKAEIERWGETLLQRTDAEFSLFFPDSQKLPALEWQSLKVHLKSCREHFEEFNCESIVDYLYCRQVTCPHCGGEAPLLNTCWLSKESGKQWGVRIVTDGKARNGKVRFETYRVSGSKGHKGEDPNFATVNKAVGMCIHCRQAINAEEIKAQARGESPVGTWKDRLYCVVAVRFQPKLDKNGKPQRYRSGDKAGLIKTEKVRFFRPPNERDLAAIAKAGKRLRENWDRWDAEGLIPTESIPLAHKTKEPLRAGMKRWCDMFTPRQLLGHVTLVEELNRLKPRILDELGEEKGRAVVTYLQFAIDKGVDYNSRQTRWIPQRCQVSGTFGRHDFSLKWTYGEMIFSGPQSGSAWGLSQIVDAYKGIADLTQPVHLRSAGRKIPVSVYCSTAAHMADVSGTSIDLVCIDPAYYNNVQYAELSDFYYVWQKRTLRDLYPDLFVRRLTNKQDEAVANPDREGGNAQAKATYERMMGAIFAECRRVLKHDGIMTMMFTHKSQDAWEALMRSLIENEWVVTAAFPVDSEFAHSQHIMDRASASSSVFIACRKRLLDISEPATWTGFGGTGVQQRIRQAVEEGLEDFKALKLNPVDEMVASYGRALRVLSEQWPVLDGDEPVGPVRAMNEASRVVAENQIRRITNGRLKVQDLSPEAAMALTLYGIYGLGEVPYDDALNLSRSLNIPLEGKTGGYEAEGRFIGINTQASSGRRVRTATAEETGFHAPLIRKGSKLRLARPDERNARRLDHPQTEWDILQGLVIAYRNGDIPVARAYLARHAEGKQVLFKDLVDVWAAEMADENLRKEAKALAFGLE